MQDITGRSADHRAPVPLRCFGTGWCAESHGDGSDPDRPASLEESPNQVAFALARSDRQYPSVTAIPAKTAPHPTVVATGIGANAHSPA